MKVAGHGPRFPRAVPCALHERRRPRTSSRLMGGGWGAGRGGGAEGAYRLSAAYSRELSLSLLATQSPACSGVGWCERPVPGAADGEFSF